MTAHDRGMQIMNILESLLCVGGYYLFLEALSLGVLKGFWTDKRDNLYLSLRSKKRKEVIETELFHAQSHYKRFNSC